MQQNLLPAYGSRGHLACCPVGAAILFFRGGEVLQPPGPKLLTLSQLGAGIPFPFPWQLPHMLEPARLPPPENVPSGW